MLSKLIGIIIILIVVALFTPIGDMFKIGASEIKSASYQNACEGRSLRDILLGR